MMKLKSPYAMHFYELVANQDTTNTIPMNLDTFREWMGIEDGLYSRSYDLRKRVLEPSKKELDANCPWSFDFTEIKENQEKEK